jgi:hypothetical protein
MGARDNPPTHPKEFPMDINGSRLKEVASRVSGQRIIGEQDVIAVRDAALGAMKGAISQEELNREFRNGLSELNRIAKRPSSIFALLSGDSIVRQGARPAINSAESDVYAGFVDEVFRRQLPHQKTEPDEPWFVADRVPSKNCGVRG